MTKLISPDEALMLQNAILNMARPQRRTLTAFRNIFRNVKDDESEGFPVLGGSSSTKLDHANDLVALHLPPSDSWLATFLGSYLPILFMVGAHMPVTCQTL